MQSIGRRQNGLQVFVGVSLRQTMGVRMPHPLCLKGGLAFFVVRSRPKLSRDLAVDFEPGNNGRVQRVTELFRWFKNAGDNKKFALPLLHNYMIKIA